MEGPQRGIEGSATKTLCQEDEIYLVILQIEGRELEIWFCFIFSSDLFLRLKQGCREEYTQAHSYSEVYYQGVLPKLINQEEPCGIYGNLPPFTTQITLSIDFRLWCVLPLVHKLN